MTETRVTRGQRCELRGEGDQRTIVGYAAVFNRYSQNLGGFVEQVDPGAFTRTLQTADVMALTNHDPNQILGRSGAGTLRLGVDDIGLRYEIDVPNTTAGRDLAESIARTDITGSSFSFRATRDGEDWGHTDQGFALRTLTDVELFDVGPVTFPAYLDTREGANAVALRSFAGRYGCDLDEVSAADNLAHLMEQTRSATPPRPLLSIARRRLELIERTAGR